MSTQNTTARKINGVDIDKLQATLAAIEATPKLAEFNFRLTNQWQGTARNRSEFTGFHGACEDFKHQTKFVMEVDEPEVLLGTNTGPNPGEVILHAVTSCVTTSMVLHAAARGFEIEAIESSVDGDIDLQGFLGLRDDVPKGYQCIRLNFRIKADCSDEQLQEIGKLGPTYSPVYNCVAPGVPMEVTFERM